MQRVIDTKADLDGLVWYPLPGFEGIYEITRCSAVRSLPRFVNSPAAGGRRRIRGKRIAITHPKGYPAINAKKDGRRYTVYLHRAIATLFVPNPDGKPCVNHIDGDKENNDPENLEWCTHQENMAHAFRTGLARAPLVGPGDKCPASKLTSSDVSIIKAKLAKGATHRELADRYGVRTGTIGHIANGRTWADVQW